VVNIWCHNNVSRLGNERYHSQGKYVYNKVCSRYTHFLMKKVLCVTCFTILKKHHLRTQTTKKGKRENN